MSSQILSLFESFVHQHFLGALKISPVNSTTPFEIGDDRTGDKEFLFISKCTPYLYEPVKGRDIQERIPMRFTMYNEGRNLILRFELFDMILESEVREHQAKGFLSVLFNQEKTHLVICDSQSYKVIWMHSIPFKMIRHQYKEIFEMYNVI